MWNNGRWCKIWSSMQHMHFWEHSVSPRSFQQNHQITVQMLSEEVNISNTYSHKILSDDFGKIELNARLVSHSLTPQHKDCSAVCSDFLETACKDNTFCSSIIAGHEAQCEGAKTHLPLTNLVPSFQKQKQRCLLFQMQTCSAQGIFFHRVKL